MGATMAATMRDPVFKRSSEAKMKCFAAVMLVAVMGVASASAPQPQQVFVQFSVGRVRRSSGSRSPGARRRAASA
jgi:hypothetical protein